MKRIFIYGFLMILSLSLWGQEEKIPMDFPCEDCTTEEGLIKELVGEGYFDFSDVEAIAISDQSYSNIAGEGKKVSLTVKTAEDGSATEIIELTDDLNELIGGFTSSGEGTTEATIHYVTDENCAATLLELKAPTKGSPRRIADYTEDIYIIDLNGDGLDVKILSNFAFSEAFSNRVSGFSPIYARNKAPLGEWTKKLLLRGFKKVTTFVTSKNPWSIAINVIASYGIGGMIEYWVGDYEEGIKGVGEAFYTHVIKEGFRGALANLVDAYGEGLLSSTITAIISYVIKTPFKDFSAQDLIIQVAVGTILNLITTERNVERLKTIVSNIDNLVFDLINPDFLVTLLNNKSFIRAYGKIANTGLRTNFTWLERILRWLNDGLDIVQDGLRVNIKKGNEQVGEIINDLLLVKYPHFGGDIIAHRTKTTTVVGRFNDMVNGGGTMKIFNSKLCQQGRNPGGINALKVPDVQVSDQEFWESFNDPWLREAAQNLDVIRAISNPNVLGNIEKADGTLTFFGREHKLLEELGFIFDDNTFFYKK